jgi:hypothetical protein
MIAFKPPRVGCKCGLVWGSVFRGNTSFFCSTTEGHSHRDSSRPAGLVNSFVNLWSCTAGSIGHSRVPHWHSNSPSQGCQTQPWKTHGRDANCPDVLDDAQATIVLQAFAVDNCGHGVGQMATCRHRFQIHGRDLTFHLRERQALLRPWSEEIARPLFPDNQRSQGADACLWARSVAGARRSNAHRASLRQ